MAGRAYPIRVSLENAEELRRQFESLGTSSEQAVERIKRALPHVGEILDRHTSDPARRATAALEQLGAKGRTAGDGLKIAGGAAQALGEQTRLTAFQAQNLAYQLNDVVVSLAGGQKLFTVLLQQGSQIAPIFGGIGATLQRIGSALASPGVGVLAALGAMGAVLGAGIVRAASLAGEVRELDVRLAAMGTTAGATARQLRDLARDLRLAGAAREDASAVTQAIIARPRIAGTGQEAGIGRLALDAAAGLGVSVGDAANRIADLYQKGVPAIKALDDQINFLTASERRQIQALAEAGNSYEAVRIGVARLQEQLGGLHERSLSPTEKAVRSLGRSWDDLLESLGNAAPIQRAIRNLDALAQYATIAAREGIGAAIDRIPGNGPDPAIARLEAQIAANERNGQPGLNRALRQQLARLRPATASASAAGIVDPLGDAALSPDAGLRAIKAEARQQDILRKQLDELTRPDRDRIAALAVGPLGRDAARVELEARREAASANLPAAETAALVASRLGALRAQQGAAAADALLPLRLQAAGLPGVAAATRDDGLAAGNLAQLRLQARVQGATTPGFDAGAYVAAQQGIQAGSAVVDAERSIVALRQQAEAQERVAAAQGRGNAAVVEAQRLNQVEQFRQQALAAGVAAESVEELAGRYGELLQRIEAANKAAANAAVLQGRRDELELAQRELALVGETEAVRGRALEILRVQQDLKRRGVELTEEQAKQEIALAEEIGRVRGRIAEAKREQELWLEPVKNAIGGIQSSFAGLFKSIASGGVNSFRDFADAVKNVFIDLAAQIAALLVFRPVVGGILGSVGLGGVAQQLGFGSQGGSGGFSLSLPGYGGGMIPIPGIGSLFSGITGSIGSGLASAFPGLASAGWLGTGALSAAAASGAGLTGAAAAEFANMAHMAGSSGLSGAAGASSFLGSWGGPIGIGAAILGQVIGGRTGGAISGAGTGLAIGSMFGPIGAGIGAVAGGLFGGLMGGKPSVGPNGTAGVLLEDGHLVGRMTSGDNGFTGGAVVGYAGEAARVLNQLAARYGTTVTPAAVGGFAEGAGQGLRFGANGQGYGIGTSADTAVADYVKAAIQRGALAGISQVDDSLIAAAVGGKLEEAFTQIQRQQVGTELAQAIAEQQQIAERFGAVRIGLTSTVDALRIDPNVSPLSHEQRLAEARGQFAAIAAKAQGGDFDAAAQLQSFGPAFLRELRSYYGPNQQFAGEFEQTLATFGRIGDVFGSRADSANAAIERMNDQLARIGEAGNDLLTQIRAELAAQRQDLNALLRQATGTR